MAKSVHMRFVRKLGLILETVSSIDAVARLPRLLVYQEKSMFGIGPRLHSSLWKRGLAAVLVAAVLAPILTSGCKFPFGDAATSASKLSTGQEIFAANCAACHGAGGEGQPEWHVKKADGTLPPPPLNGDGHTWHHGDGLLYRIVSEGGKTLEDPNYPSFRSGMPAFGDRLTQEEIVAVLEYVQSLWEDKTKLGVSIRESQALVSEQDPYPVGAVSE